MMSTDGALASGKAVKSTCTWWVPSFPAASVAVKTTVFIPRVRGTGEVVQLVVPEAVPLAPVVTFCQVTLVTPTLSEAMPSRVTGLVGAVYVGKVVVIVGGTISAR